MALFGEPSGEFLKTKPDEPRRVSALPDVEHCRLDGGHGLWRRVAEIDERGDRLRDRAGRLIIGINGLLSKPESNFWIKQLPVKT